MSFSIDRREFLGWAAATVAAGCAEGHDCEPDGDPIFEDVAPARAETRVASAPFTLGVASGDPLHDRVILWTRLAPEPLEAGGGMIAEDVPVGWQVARDEAFTDIVSQGVATARAEDAHAVHVDAVGLDADRWYYYRFFVGEHKSPVGRTRTFPCADAEPASTRFAFASCQKYRDGYYTAHHHLAEEDLDFVLFLGDYIYESGGDSVREENFETEEAEDLDGYRHRYAIYKRDQHLQAAHAAFPWIVVWDDHEVDNDYAGVLAVGDEAPTAEFAARRAAAYRAYWEHMPIRAAAPVADSLRLYRSFAFGDLFELFVVDSRQHRDDQVCSDDDFGPVCDARDDPSRTMLGFEQERWLFDGLAASTRRWKLIGNQVALATLDFDGTVANFDIWDGYTAARQRLLDVLRDVNNAVVLTGDLHVAGVADLTAFGNLPGGSRVIAAELVGTSITSGGDEPASPIAELVTSEPHIHYVNASVRGYMRCTLDRAGLRTDLRVVSTVEAPEADVRTEASFVVDDGIPGVRLA